jgi:CubicO group peptidase (beta-lactamase class C family)
VRIAQSIGRGLVLTLLVTPAAAGQFRNPGDFDDYVQRSLDLWRVPGVAIAVVRNDSVIVLRGYGRKAIGRPDSVTSKTMFEIGSTSKAFSSALLAMLVDDGAIGWDDPVTKHLPGFALRDPWVTREVTLRDLLSHRVGVTGLYNGLLTSTRAEIVRRTRYLAPNLGFRDRYDYSNMMYATAGEVAAAVAGAPWERLLEARILRPLGMTATTTDISRFFDSTRFAHCFYCPFPNAPVTLADVRTGQDAALPHMLVGDSVRSIPWQSYDNAVSAGSVISNVTDLAQWLRFLLAEGAIGGRRLIGLETFRELHRPQSVIRPSGWLQMVAEASPSSHYWAYGLGWRMNDYRGRKVIWHTGGIAGFLAYVGVVPEEHLGIVALSNGDLGYELLPQSLALRIIDEQLGPPVRDWSAELAVRVAADRQQAAERAAVAAKARVPGTRPSLPLERYAGRYGNDVYGDVDVATDGNRLWFRIPGGAQGELVHWHYDVFKLQLNASWSGDFVTTFRPDDRGRIVEMQIDGVGSFDRR